MRRGYKERLIAWGTVAYRIARMPVKWYWKIFKIQTSGVRVMIVHEKSLVLVRHWYNGLCVMPGGGIKRGETPEVAAIREVREEVGIEIGQLDFKLGTYSNTREGKNDIVHCFVVVLDQNISLDTSGNSEVAERMWVAMDRLPEHASKATKGRVKEYLDGAISQETRPW